MVDALPLARLLATPANAARLVNAYAAHRDAARAMAATLRTDGQVLAALAHDTDGDYQLASVYRDAAPHYENAATEWDAARRHADGPLPDAVAVTAHRDAALACERKARTVMQEVTGHAP